MNIEAITQRAIQAAQTVLGREVIIETNADFTPAGKRTARIVRHSLSGRPCKPIIRWYVAGKAYVSKALTNDNIDLTAQWKDAGQPSGTDDPHRPFATQLTLI